MNTTLDLNQEKTCLVVVDMINGFVFEGALSDMSIDACTPLIVDLIQQFKKANQPILAFCDSHPENCMEFSSFPPHCLENSHESELIDALKPYEDEMIILLKNSTNGFVQPQFLDTFKALLPLDKVVITGCCTDICVLQFALSLKGYINQHNLPIQVIVIKDAVQTFNASNHDQKQYNEMAFTLMMNAGILVTDQIEKRK